MLIFYVFYFFLFFLFLHELFCFLVCCLNYVSKFERFHVLLTILNFFNCFFLAAIQRISFFFFKRSKKRSRKFWADQMASLDFLYKRLPSLVPRLFFIFYAEPKPVNHGSFFFFFQKNFFSNFIPFFLLAIHFC